MDQKERLFWVLLSFFTTLLGTGPFVIIEQHIIWGTAMIVVGFLGMVGCAWPIASHGYQIAKERLKRTSKIVVLSSTAALGIAAGVSISTVVYRHLHSRVGTAVAQQQKTAFPPPAPSKPASASPPTTTSANPHKTHRTNITKEQKLAIVKKIVEDYAREHGDCPSTEFVNKKLRGANEPLQVTNLVCPAETPGSFVFLDNQGNVDEASLDKLVIHGTPKGKITLFQTAPNSHTGKIHVGEAQIYYSDDTVPLAPANAEQDDFRTRIDQLISEMASWEDTARDSEPAPQSDPTSQYWSTKMPEFHRLFGSRLILLAEQLRKCGDQSHPLSREIYGREVSNIPAPQIIQLDILDLRQLADSLPQDETKNECANR